MGSSTEATDEATKRYGTRTSADRRRPSNLDGFVVESDNSSSSPSPAVNRSAPSTSALSTTSTTTGNVKERPSVPDRPQATPAVAGKRGPDFSDLSRRALNDGNKQRDAVSETDSDSSSDSGSKAMRSSASSVKSSSVSTTSTRFARGIQPRSAGAGRSLPAVLSPTVATSASTSSSSSSTTGTSSAATKSLKAAVLAATNPAFPSHRSDASAGLSTKGNMGPPKKIPAKPRASASSIRSDDGEGSSNRAGDNEGNPIDFTDSESSFSSITARTSQPRQRLVSTLVLVQLKCGEIMRADIAFLLSEAAIKIWTKAKEAGEARRTAAKEGREYKIAPGMTASLVYLNYDKAEIGKDKQGKPAIVFPCRCCIKTKMVPRPFHDSGTSNLWLHAKTQKVDVDGLEQAQVDKMLQKQAEKATAPTIIILTPGVTRQMAVAWVCMFARPISIVEDQGFLAFLHEQQRATMSKQVTVNRDISRWIDPCTAPMPRRARTH
ncbi:hypothetical protein OC844_005343 [Tilletia horrida]|nr:hypothetical protein OC844_005343 [Tilletia horrida]